MMEKLTRVVTKPIVKIRIVKDKEGNEVEQEYTVIESVTETLTDEEEAKIKDEWQRDEVEMAKTKYISDRKREYPSIEAQLEYMQENGFVAWQKMIQDIKDKYPKPDSIIDF